MFRILLVEDDPDVAELLGLCVTTLVDSATPVHAPSGKDALARFEAGEHFDLVVCDVMMPGMDGARLLRELRDRGLLTDQRVVILSAVERERITEVLAFPEVVAFVRKPVEPVELAELLTEHLTR